MRGVNMAIVKCVKLILVSVVVSSLMAINIAKTNNNTSNNTHSLNEVSGYEIASLTELDTSLKFKRTPSQVQVDVMNGKPPSHVRMSTKPLKFEEFVQLYVNMSKAKQGSSFIGVVVDTGDKNWKGGHIRDVQKIAQYLISGDLQNKKPGIALTDGANIAGIIPIAYNSNDRVKKFVDAPDMANDEMEDITVNIGEVLIVVNNHVLPRDENGHFPTKLSDMYYHILDAAVLGRFGYDMREHANDYSVHVDRAAIEQRKRTAIKAWDYKDTPFFK